MTKSNNTHLKYENLASCSIYIEFTIGGIIGIDTYSINEIKKNSIRFFDEMENFSSR